MASPSLGPLRKAAASSPSSPARSKAFHQCLPAAAGLRLMKRSRTSLTTAAAQKHQRMQQAAAALAASGLAAALLFSPGPVRAEDMPSSAAAAAAAAEAQAHSLLLPAGSLNLSAPEAPALVADSGSAVLDGVKGIVESGLQDLTENSMSAVGGPVTSEVLSASMSQGPTADSTADQPLAAAAPQHQQHQQQQHMHAVWCHAWAAYCDALERSPLVTKVYTGVVGTLLGDLAAQILAHTSKQSQEHHQHHGSSSSSSSSKQGFQFDAMRSARLCLYSAAIGTPMCHAWYNLLESAVMHDTPLAPAAVASKVALDQLVQTPFGMALFFAVMKLLEGKPDQVQQELKSKMVPALLANWKLWPAAQLINFTLIPQEQRILYGNIIGICWTCVISKMQQAPSAAAASPAAAETVEHAQSLTGQPAHTAVEEGFDLRRRTSVTA